MNKSEVYITIYPLSVQFPVTALSSTLTETYIVYYKERYPISTPRQTPTLYHLKVDH